jgi:hypothetical protein
LTYAATASISSLEPRRIVVIISRDRAGEPMNV